MKHQPFTFKVIASICLLIWQVPLWSQEVAREVGIGLTSLEDFSAIYKWQKASDKYRRITVAGARVNTDLEESIYTTVDVTLGTEKRREIAEQTDWLRGLQYGVSASFADQGQNDPNFNLAVRLAYLLGIQYRASSHFNVGLEWLPGLSVSYNDASESLNAILSADFSNVRLFGVYKFSSPSRK